jgi:hypothetical protein
MPLMLFEARACRAQKVYNASVMELTLRDSITVADDVLFRELDGEAVLLNLKTGIYFGLNPVATRMWQLIAEQHSLARVLDALAGEYDADQAVLETDLLELGRQLCAGGLCAIVPGS